MKYISSISGLICLLLIDLSVNGQIINNKKSIHQFFPLKVGNYWVYSNSNSPSKLDTVKITNTGVIGLDTGFVYNNKLMFERNDTVYDYQSQRIRIPFRTLIYFPSDKETEYFISVAGDPVGFRTVIKLNEPYVVRGKEYYNCYEFRTRTERNIYYIVISYGIGIIEIRTNNEIRSLIDYNVD